MWLFSLFIIKTREIKKVLKLTKTASFNVPKCGLFFNIVPFTVHSFLPLVLQCLKPIDQKVMNRRYDFII